MKFNIEFSKRVDNSEHWTDWKKSVFFFFFPLKHVVFGWTVLLSVDVRVVCDFIFSAILWMLNVDSYQRLMRPLVQNAKMTNNKYIGLYVSQWGCRRKTEWKTEKKGSELPPLLPPSKKQTNKQKKKQLPPATKDEGRLSVVRGNRSGR